MDQNIYNLQVCFRIKEDAKMKIKNTRTYKDNLPI